MGLRVEKLMKEMNNKLILKGITLDIPEGQIYGLVGANGAGKTTFFRHLLGIYTQDSGEIQWNGEVLSNLEANKIGYLPEERGLYPKRTVNQQLTFFGKLRGMEKKEIKKNIDFWLNYFKIEGNKNRKVSELSKGNQQKIQFIASIIHNPELVILDEPFSGLDPVNSNQLKKAIMLLKKNGSTVIFSSHQMANVEEICENICLIKDGTILLEGNLNEIKNSVERRKIIVQADFEKEKLREQFSIDSYNEKDNIVSFFTKNNNEAKAIQKFIFQSDNIEQFRIEPMSLNDIFLERVGE